MMDPDVGVKHVTLPLLSVFMITGNGMLIHVTLTHKRLRTVTNYLILSLAVSDLLVGCLVVPLMVAAEEGFLGSSPLTCLYVFSLSIILILVSCLTLMVIAVERFIAITRPLRHHAIMTTRNTMIVIIFCWLYGTFVGCLPLVGWNAVLPNSNERHTTIYLNNSMETETLQYDLETPTNNPLQVISPRIIECRYQNVIPASFAAFMYPGHFIPLWILLIILYGRIYLRSRGNQNGSRSKVRRWSCSMQRQRSTGRARENWRALRILAIVVGYFLFSWLPVVVWYALLYKGFTVEYVHTIKPTLPYWFYNMGITLAFGNSAVNPYLYGFGNRTVRKAWIESVQRAWRRVLGTCKGSIGKENNNFICGTTSRRLTATTTTITATNNTDARPMTTRV